MHGPLLHRFVIELRQTSSCVIGPSILLIYTTQYHSTWATSAKIKVFLILPEVLKRN
jgi:hypothetical protein